MLAPLSSSIWPYVLLNPCEENSSPSRKPSYILGHRSGSVSLIGRVASRIDRDPIILSHHPLCGRFEDHFFRVRGRRVCIGCATVYPSALATVLLVAALHPIPFVGILSTAVSFFVLNLSRFVFRPHRISVLFNVSLGISLGCAILSVAYAPGALRLPVLLAWLAVGIAFSLVKGQRVFAECRSCERYQEFPHCCKTVNPGKEDCSLTHAK